MIPIGPLSFDPAAGRLTRDGQPIPLGGRALAVLTALAGTEGTVPKEALLTAAWPGVTVEEGNLTVQIAGLRRLLGEDAILTVPRVGYRLRRDAPLPEPAGLPRLAVMPFTALGASEGEGWYADGITDDIIAALCRFREFTTVSRHAAFARRDATLAEVTAAFALAYVITGSLRRSGDRLRLSAALTDAATGAQIWAQTFDGEAGDVFDFQDRITEAVVGAVAPEVVAAEIRAALRQRPASADAYDLYLRALAAMHAETEQKSLEAIDLIERALALDPGNARYHSLATWAHGHRATAARTSEAAPSLARSTEHALALIRLAPDDPQVLAHAALALIHTRHDYAYAMDLARRALDLNPNDTFVCCWVAIAHLHCGQIAEAERLARRAIALSPGDPFGVLSWCALAHAALVDGRIAESIPPARQALALNPGFPATLWMLTAAHALEGDMVEARRWLAELGRLTPNATVAGIRAGQPRMIAGRIEPILAGLALAGLREA